MSQYPPNPNNNPYGQNQPDPNANQGTAYGGPPSGQNPYNPYPNNPGTNPNPYGPYSPNQNLPTQRPTGPGSNPDYGPYNPYAPNPPTPGPTTNPNYDPYDPYGQTAASANQNYNQYSTVPPAPPVPPPAAPAQPRRGLSMRVILIAVVALLLIIGGIIIGLVSYNNTQQGYTNATATARANASATAAANANATATANANASATANANASATAIANATATALVTSQYPPFTTLAFNDPLTAGNINSGWSSATQCQATSTGYQVSIARAGFLEECFNLSNNYTDFAYQVTMTITQGDCGGLVFRAQDNQNFYTYIICQNGQFNAILFVKNANAGSTNVKSSSAIHTGLNQANTLAVVVQGDTTNLYINGQHVDTFTDRTFTHGGIGVLASDNTAPTAVNYTNAVVWTAS